MLMIKSGMATSLPDVVPLGIGVVWGVNGFGVVDVRRTRNFVTGGKRSWLHTLTRFSGFSFSFVFTATPPAPLCTNNEQHQRKNEDV